MKLQNGDTVVSLFPREKDKNRCGTVVSAQHKRASKEAPPGWLVRVKWDDTKRINIYHEDFLQVITPLEKLL